MSQIHIPKCFMIVSRFNIFTSTKNIVKMSSLKIVLVKSNKSDTYGYLKIRTIKNRKARYQTLKIKVDSKYWIEQKQRVRKSAPNSEKINLKIEETLLLLAKHDNQIQAIQSSSKTILSYYDEIISTTITTGTKLKYEGIKNKFKSYLISKGLVDIKFDDLNELHVKSFYKFIIDSGCSNNTANYNIKSFKSLINKAIRAGIVNYYINPFQNLQLKFDIKQKEALEKVDIQKIINKVDYKDTRDKSWYGYRKYRRFIPLYEIASIFLFQFNMQGMRCSDMQLLRWSNFKIHEGLLLCNYTMRKTGKEMTITLTPFALECMKYSIFQLIPKVIEMYDKLQKKKDKILKGKDKLDMIDTKKLENVRVEMYELLGVSVHLYGKEDKWKNLFVFPFLNPNDFNEYNNKKIGNLNELQYKRLTGTRHYYNKMLKIVQKQNEIQTNISSHTARHSYSTILVENDVSLIELSATLGHKHIATTQSYISRLNVNNIYDLNSGISKMFYK